jgi:hypothetical protein
MSVRQHDVRQAVAVQVDNTNVSCRPLLSPERGTSHKPSTSVVQVDDFGVWSVVADDHIEVAISVDVNEHARVRTVRLPPEWISGLKGSIPITEQNEVFERPVAALHKHNVPMAI